MNRRLTTLMTAAIAALAAALAAPAGARAAQAAAAPGAKKFIVTFREGTTKAQREQAARALGLTLKDDLAGLKVSVMESAGPITPESIDASKAGPDVVQVEEDVYRNWLLDAPASFQAAPLPSVDAIVRDLRGKRRKPASSPSDGSGSAGVPWGVQRVNAPAAWSSGEGAGVKVAVVDTGIDCTHPDLQCDFSAGMNILDPSSQPMDDNEHGTHVAGTIAGRGNGGPLGVAPKATLIPVKVLDANGSGSLSDIVKGIEWAADNGADVINMSLGGPSGSAAMERAVKYALSKGVVVVAAAGNSGPNPDTVGYPAGYPGVIAVAASDSNDQVADFSSRGSAVAFIAPGVNVTSTVPGGGTATLSGTSMASPHVAGLAALAIERGAQGPDGVRAAFRAAATPLPGLAKTEEGYGMIDAAKLGR
ncbi:MAG: S8 family serine peptidase [Elusimicrobia bacterium]|nr:S8 family serine peptidase [Elusimicrobiota bacterium]